MKVITISRSYGSAGSLFGRKLAERLGYKYVDDRFITRMKTNKEASSVLMLNLEDEKAPNFMDRFSELVNNRSYFLTAITVALCDLVLRRDIVVVGGGGHLILEGYPCKIRLQIYRNLLDRVLDIAQEKGIGQKEAIDLVEKKDKEKKRFISYYFDRDLFDPSAFDIIFNASSVPIEDALDMVEVYSNRYFEKVDMEDARIFAAKKLLENRAQLAVFHLDLARKGRIVFEARDEGVLEVKGIIGGTEQKERLLKALRSMRGVNKVIDQLKVGILSRQIY
mgnify:CR=1 FL=1